MLPFDSVPQRLRFGIYMMFLAICFLGGGGSRADIMSLLYVRPAAILCLASILVVPGRIDFRLIRVPLALLLVLALWMTAQLVPLPPGIWTGLSGRELIAPSAAVLGTEQPWRPISVAPDLTLNSLVSLVVPLTGLVGFAAIAPEHRRGLLLVLLLAVLVSSLLGMLQISGGVHNPFYLYAVTNENQAVGLFANRNHQAVLLAAAFPMLALWASQAKGSAQVWRRPFIAASAGIFLVPMLLVTGSRAGLALGGAAAAWACFQFVKERRTVTGRPLEWRTAMLTLVSLVGVAALFAFLAFSRAVALQRLFETQDAELRGKSLPVVVRIAEDMLPFGGGFGTFDPLYRMSEPDALLSPRYLNHAHNDLVELAVTGGAPAVILLLFFLVWWLAGSVKVFRCWRSPLRDVAFARLGSVMIALLLAASLVDYPLRVPTMMALLAIACGWLAAGWRRSAEAAAAQR